MRFLISLTLSLLLALLASPTLAGQPSVRVVRLTPSNLSPPTQDDIEEISDAMTESQEFFADEIQKRGKDSKTFKLERDKNNQVCIHKIKGKLTLKGYLDLVSNEELVPIAREVNEALGYDKYLKGDDKITVIFIAGIEFLTGDNHATNVSSCPKQGAKLEHDDFTCYHYCFIPADSTKLSYITAHELGHSFGLGHSKSRKYLMYKDAVKKSLHHTRLSAQETRWLDCHRYFNDQNTVKSVPSIAKVHIPEWFNRRLRNEFRFDIENKFSLHQAYLLSNDGVVLDYDYISSNKSTATFDVRTRYLREFKVEVKILDTRGNYVHYDIDLFNPPIDLSDVRAAPSLTVPKTVVSTWGDIKANR